MTPRRAAGVVLAVLAGAALLAAGGLVWIGTARLRAVEGALGAVLPAGWEVLATARAGEPDLLERDLRAAMGAALLARADAAGIVFLQANGTLFAAVPHGFETEYFDVMAGCWVNIEPVALVRGSGGGWRLGQVHCVADRPPGVPRRPG